MSIETASISIPLTDLADQVAPLIEERLEARFAEKQVALNKRRAKLDTLEVAIAGVVKAVEHVEKSRNSRSEPASLNALVAAASGLRSARRNFLKGL